MSNEKIRITTLSVDLIDDPANPMRSSIGDVSIHELASSIKSVGLVQPLVVRQVGTRFEVVAGHRRLAAARMANLAVVPVVVRDVDDQEADILKIHENLFREDVNIVDEATFIREAMARLNLNTAGFARLINRSDSYVRDRLNLLSYDDYIIEALKKGQISFSVAKYLSRIEDSGRRREYIDYAVRDGVTPAVAQRWYEFAKEGTLPATPSEEFIRETENAEPVKIYPVPCVICGGGIPPAEAKLVFIHKECEQAAKLSRITE